MRGYKAARLCCPLFVAQTNPVPLEVESLRAFRALDDDATIHQLKMELPSYKVAAMNVQEAQNRLQWWRQQDKLPAWQSATIIVASVPPSSAAAERIFSLLAAAMTHQQERTLEDQLELELMLQYNRGRVSDEV